MYCAYAYTETGKHKIKIKRMAYHGMTGKLKQYGQLIIGGSYICDKRVFIKGKKKLLHESFTVC